jgi:hypothetical protein
MGNARTDDDMTGAAVADRIVDTKTAVGAIGAFVDVLADDDNDTPSLTDNTVVTGAVNK